MNSPDSNEPLTRALAGWRLAPPRNPHFRTAVRDRLEAARGAPTWTGYLRAHGALVATALAVAVLLGAWSGRERARQHDAAMRATLVADYVHGLDARWMRLP